MLTYQYNQDIIRIRETVNKDDVEFHIQVLKEKPFVDHLKQVQNFFEDNEVYTDVLFYAYADHEYRVIVRHDYYTDFILALMKHRLLQSVKWEKEGLTDSEQ
ncbi:hypothetical protein [Lihuaxuella thermophila]|uniref:Uncharacterized protein n=1 Tax=Lihuaxuella thermophila TaxID=1173111 RepID=A0A1H8CFS8_9BACL|nr:hypothetical protein [Lihuaxuella thermophila]SEM93749.1 hypothetical protein SAMN05444955_103264 [Lihuaxuella thermophila]